MYTPMMKHRTPNVIEGVPLSGVPDLGYVPVRSRSAPRNWGQWAPLMPLPTYPSRSRTGTPAINLPAVNPNPPGGPGWVTALPAPSAFAVMAPQTSQYQGYRMAYQRFQPPGLYGISDYIPAGITGAWHDIKGQVSAIGTSTWFGYAAIGLGALFVWSAVSGLGGKRRR